MGAQSKGTDESVRTDQTEVGQIEIAPGVQLAQIGLGVFQVPPDEAQRVVEDALELGYRHIDTAAAYVNETGVGAAIKASGLAREEVFVTSKLRNGDQGYDSTSRAYADTCGRLGLDRLDLYLIHWPYPSAGLFVDSWRALEKLAADGSVRSVGVSNFLPEHLDAIAAASELRPAVNQVELHPTFQQTPVLAATRAAGAAVEAYSPLGQGADLDSAPVLAAARVHEATPAQVVLAWHLQQGHIVIPKTARRERMVENLAAASLRLSEGELADISGLDSEARIGGDPATFALTQIR
ncbi:aldo/keto reductase [uncultured Friedmanniella sp.]|uniref:aldo/keto reductase n=1 Tax=uncultured Friedmanniella sp. TaxID=335381 RepID=UPI0035CA3C5A